MLSNVKRFMEQRGTASLADIAHHVDADPDAVRGMVEYWVAKRRICEVPVACGGCTQCDPATIETYRWLDGSSPPDTSTSS